MSLKTPSGITLGSQPRSNDRHISLWKSIGCVVVGLMLSHAESAVAETGETGTISAAHFMSTVRFLYKAAATKQAGAIRDDGERNYSEPDGLLAARDIYVGLLAILEARHFSSEDSLEKRYASRTYSEIAWFEFRAFPKEYFGPSPQELLDRALNLDADNAVGWFEKARMLRMQSRVTADSEGEIERSCKKALSIDKEFPEAWLELSLYSLRTRQFSDAQQQQTEFIAYKGKYKPELHFFDVGYPERGEKIIVGAGKFMERDIFQDDVKRFDLARLMDRSL